MSSHWGEDDTELEAISQDELERIEMNLLLEGIYRAYGFDFPKLLAFITSQTHLLPYEPG
ncbi:MAG: hypothetical protein ACQEXQ_19045 [Bacillota bacterium]